MASTKLPNELSTIRAALFATGSPVTGWIGPADQRALLGFGLCIGAGQALAAFAGLEGIGIPLLAVAAGVAAALRYTAPHYTWTEKILSALHTYQPKDDPAYQQLLRTIQNDGLDRAGLTEWYRAEVRKHRAESEAGTPEGETLRRLLQDRLKP